MDQLPSPREPRDRMVTLILCLFLGSFGMHRFYTGHTTVGLIQLFTAGGCGIWWAVDVTMILMRKYRDFEGRELV